MSGKRNNLSSLDLKILNLLFETVGLNYDDLKKNDYDKSKIMGMFGLGKTVDSKKFPSAIIPKSTDYINKVLNESGRRTKNNLMRLKEFGLVNRIEIEKGTITYHYWSITSAGWYCVLAKLERGKIKGLVKKYAQNLKYSPSVLITSFGEPDYAIINRFIFNGNWDAVEELLEEVNGHIDKYHYKTIMVHVREWFRRYCGYIPTGLVISHKL